MYQGQVERDTSQFDACLIPAREDNMVALRREWLHLQRDLVKVLAQCLEELRPALPAVPNAGPRNGTRSLETEFRVGVQGIQHGSHIAALKCVIDCLD